MDKVKYYLKATSILTIEIIISIFIISIMYYFHFLNDWLNNFLIYLVPLIFIFITSFKLGINAKAKGFLEGIKISLITVILLLLFNLILYRQFNIKTGIFYLVILITSLLGSTLGINKNKD